MSDEGRDFDEGLRALRSRADEDFLQPLAAPTAGRHQLDVEPGLRVSVTRSRYPNRADGDDLYAVTLSRRELDRGPDDSERDAVLHGLFGDAAPLATERPGGPLVRMFRLPAGI